jgi:hypothetical protein
VQSAQTPLAPHSVSEVPGWQVPAPDPEQHPPLHGWVAEQEGVHVLLAVSQDSPVGQSAAVTQPQLPLAKHDVPDGPATHESHATPVAPHSACVAPVAHVPALQQPPLQG